MALKSLFSTNLELMLLEVGIYFVAIAFAIAWPTVQLPQLASWERRYRTFAAKRSLAILSVILLALVLRGALIPVLPTPVPGVHDEYSYILAGDTFAAGRVTNPPHTLWQTMETFYVLQQPTYASMYPPAQGIVLALGDIISGHPWAGVYLSMAIMCGALCWMLQGWLPPHWALTGAIIALLRFGVYSYWTESYWGGAAAAIGGALILGAVPRLSKQLRVSSALALSLGLLILANSRPFEGLLLAVPALGFLLLRLVKHSTPAPALFRKLAIPLGLTLTIGFIAMGYYFWRITGSPLQMPYQVHSTRYEVTGPFFWQPLRPTPHFRYVVMEQYHVGRQTAAYILSHSLRGWLAETWRKAESILIFYFWPAVLPTIIAIPMIWRLPKIRFALITTLVMFIGLTLEIWPMTLHYHAPLMAVMSLLLVQVMRYWRTVRWRDRPVGTAISWAIPIACVLMLTLRLGAAVRHIPMPDHGLAPWFTVTSGNLDRAKVSNFLEQQPGSQLAFVRYDESHHVDEEWVHNSADVDASKVVWVRDAGPEQNQRVLDYFQHRRAWLVEADQKPPRVTSISGLTVLSLQKPH